MHVKLLSVSDPMNHLSLGLQPQLSKKSINFSRDTWLWCLRVRTMKDNSKHGTRTLKAGHGTRKESWDRRIVSQLPLKLYDQFISCWMMLETLWGLVLANTGHPAVSQTWCSNRQDFPRKEVSQSDRAGDKIGICHLESPLEISLCFALTECITDVRLARRRHSAAPRGCYGSSEAGVSRDFLGE